MSIIAWIVLGLVAGFIGSKLVNKRGEGLVLGIQNAYGWSSYRSFLPKRPKSFMTVLVHQFGAVRALDRRTVSGP